MRSTLKTSVLRPRPNGRILETREAPIESRGQVGQVALTRNAPVPTYPT